MLTVQPRLGLRHMAYPAWRGQKTGSPKPATQPAGSLAVAWHALTRQSLPSAAVYFGKTLSPHDHQFVREIDTQLARQCLEKCRDLYLVNAAGLKEGLSIAEINSRFPALTAPETYTRMEALSEAYPKNLKLRRLRSVLMNPTMGPEVSRETMALNKLRRQVDSALAKGGTEGAAYLDAVAQYQEQLMVVINRSAEDVQKQGYENLLDYHGGDSLTGLGEKALRLLDKTDDIYWNAAKGQVIPLYPELAPCAPRNIPADALIKALWGDPNFNALEAAFKAETLLPAARKTVEDGLKIPFSERAQEVSFHSLAEYRQFVDQPDRQARILMDLAERPGKELRAYTYPVHVPDEIYLVVPSKKGMNNHISFFHELGHSLHFTNISPRLSHAESILGGTTVTESYAYLFQKLFENRHWLEHVAGLPPEKAKQVAQKNAFRSLEILRQLMCRFQFELKLQDGTPLGDKPAELVKMQQERTGLKTLEKQWPAYIDLNFGVVNYIQAMLLEAQLRQHMQQQFGSPQTQGEDWYTNPKAGKFLMKLWSRGNLTPQQLADSLQRGNPAKPKGDPLDETALIHVLQKIFH